VYIRIRRLSTNRRSVCQNDGHPRQETKLVVVRLTMASLLSPNRSSPELQALDECIYDRDDYANILSILCSRRKWMTKEKKAKLLTKFVETELLLTPRKLTSNPALSAVICAPCQYNHIERLIISTTKPSKNTTVNWQLLGSNCHPMKWSLPNQEPLLLLVSKLLATVSKTICLSVTIAKTLLLSAPA
jgi:hypothetical protein